MKNVFNQHCKNNDPWAWSYAWTYACWSNNSLGIIPSKNLVSNIGIGPDASNTKQKIKVSMYPSRLERMTYPMNHPSVYLNKDFDYNYYCKSRSTFYKRFANKLIRLKNIFVKTLIHG